MVKSFCKRQKFFILLILALGVSCTLSLYAQNGVSLETMQNDPYFANGDAEKEQERNSKGEAPQEEPKDPDPEVADPNSKNFYNAQNWILGVEEPNEEKEPVIPQPRPGTSQPQPRDNITFAKYSDQLRADEPWFYRHVDLTIGYSAFGAIPFGEKSIPELFNMSRLAYIAPVGMNFKTEVILFRVKEFALTLGVLAEGTYMWRTEERYKLSAWQLNTSLFGAIRFHFIANSSIELFAGVGALMMLDTKFNWVSGAVSGPYNYIYLQPQGGLMFSYYFTRLVGLDVSADFAWPIIIDEPFYPQIHVNVGLGVHL